MICPHGEFSWVSPSCPRCAADQRFKTDQKTDQNPYLTDQTHWYIATPGELALRRYIIGEELPDDALIFTPEGLIVGASTVEEMKKIPLGEFEDITEPKQLKERS